MKLNLRTLVLVLLTLTILCPASIPLTGVISAAASYQGKCYGFTDSVWDCTFWEFARSEMDFMIILTYIPMISLAAAWLVTAVTWGINQLIPTARARAAANWISAAVLIILSLIFIPSALLILGGAFLSILLGR